MAEPKPDRSEFSPQLDAFALADRLEKIAEYPNSTEETKRKIASKTIMVAVHNLRDFGYTTQTTSVGDVSSEYTSPEGHEEVYSDIFALQFFERLHTSMHDGVFRTDKNGKI